MRSIILLIFFTLFSVAAYSVDFFNPFLSVSLVNDDLVEIKYICIPVVGGTEDNDVGLIMVHDKTSNIVISIPAEEAQAISHEMYQKEFVSVNKSFGEVTAKINISENIRKMVLELGDKVISMEGNHVDIFADGCATAVDASKRMGRVLFCERGKSFKSSSNPTEKQDDVQIVNGVSFMPSKNKTSKDTGLLFAPEMIAPVQVFDEIHTKIQGTILNDSDNRFEFIEIVFTIKGKDGSFIVRKNSTPDPYNMDVGEVSYVNVNVNSSGKEISAVEYNITGKKKPSKIKSGSSSQRPKRQPKAEPAPQPEIIIPDPPVVETPAPQASSVDIKKIFDRNLVVWRLAQQYIAGYPFEIFPDIIDKPFDEGYNFCVSYTKGDPDPEDIERDVNLCIAAVHRAAIDLRIFDGQAIFRSRAFIPRPADESQFPKQLTVNQVRLGKGHAYCDSDSLPTRAFFDRNWWDWTDGE